jgi:type II secretory pathway pseudopilin PulG
MAGQKNNALGFTILELLVAMAIFMIICAAMFELLDLSQKRYSSETQLTAAFQDARLAMDQIVRDVNAAGYPPRTMYSSLPPPGQYANVPIAWSPNYNPGVTDCQLGSTCITPSDYDLIVETRLSTDANVSWLRYYLNGTTLYRQTATKASGDPLGIVSAGETSPLISNVMNNPDATLLAQIRAQYPSMFPGGSPQPIFAYTCDTPRGPVPCTSAQAVGYNTPENIRDVNVTLIVMTPQKDMQTQSYKLVELTGRGHRLNPDN